MGFEPTTFCMASRRSSQLSYIRADEKYSRGSRGRIQRFVHEPCPPARCAPDGRRCTSPSDPARERVGVGDELAQCLVLDLVLAAHLLARAAPSRTRPPARSPALDRRLEAGDQGAVLRHVVRRHADRLALRVEHGSVLGLEHVTVGRRAGIAARAAVGGEPRLHRRASS